MSTDLTTRIAELTATIEARLDEDERIAAAASLCAEVKDGRWYDGEDEINDDNGLRLATINSPPVTTHIARNDPARVLRRVKATRSLAAAILGRPHVLDDSEWYGCQAVTHSYSAADGSPFPDRDGRYVPTGRECTCGRDEDVAKLLGIIASEWEE